MITMNEYLKKALNEKVKAEGTGYSIFTKGIMKRAKNLEKIESILSQIRELNVKFAKSATMDFNNSNAKKIETLMDKVKM